MEAVPVIEGVMVSDPVGVPVPEPEREPDPEPEVDFVRVRD
jgi:hypothetical protein